MFSNASLCLKKVFRKSAACYKVIIFISNILVFRFLEIVLGSHDNRVKASPVYGNFKDLAPLCICVSEHEVVYDQAMLLAGRAMDQGVDVTVGAWKVSTSRCSQVKSFQCSAPTNISVTYKLLRKSICVTYFPCSALLSPRVEKPFISWLTG